MAHYGDYKFISEDGLEIVEKYTFIVNPKRIDDPVKDYPLDSKGKEMIPYFPEKNDDKTYIHIGKMTPDQVYQENRKISINDFKKNDYNNIPRGTQEQKHFAKKYNLK